MGHLRKHGYSVEERDTTDLAPIKRRFKIPDHLASCHTGTVAGYVVEGHVPADLIDRLLAEKPKIVGLAVPGMPVGSPGMEVPGQAPQRYEVIAFDANGGTSVFARR